MIAIFTNMLSSKGGTWQVNEWCSNENRDWTFIFWRPKRECLALLFKNTAFMSSLYPVGWCVKCWTVLKWTPCDWLLFAISYTVCVWFKWILCTTDSPLSVIAPGGLFGPYHLADVDCPNPPWIYKIYEMPHARTEKAEVLAFNFLSCSSTFQLKIREEHTSKNALPF